MHKRIAHGARAEVNGCIDSVHCTGCGTLMHNRAAVLVQVYRSTVCRLNLLLRGSFLSREAAAEFAFSVARLRRDNKAAGRDQHFAERQCTRVFGPFLPVINFHGEVMISPDGHPLGPGRRWCRPAQLGA